MTRPITTSIRYTLDANTAPPGSILRAWEPEFLITAKLYPAEPATYTCDQYGGDVDIVGAHKLFGGNRCAERARREPCYFCDEWEAAFRDLLESNIGLRHQIEELLCEAARERIEV
jgi:hypothetical protein